MHIYVSSNIGHLYVIGNIFKYKSTILFIYLFILLFIYLFIFYFYL